MNKLDEFAKAALTGLLAGNANSSIDNRVVVARAFTLAAMMVKESNYLEREIKDDPPTVTPEVVANDADMKQVEAAKKAWEWLCYSCWVRTSDDQATRLASGLMNPPPRFTKFFTGER